jgi:protein TonB
VRTSSVVVSAVLHVGVAAVLLGVAKGRSYRPPTAVTVVAPKEKKPEKHEDEKPKPKPPPPPPPAASTQTTAAPAPAAPSASPMALGSFMMSSGDGPGVGVAIPVPRAAVPARLVASLGPRTHTPRPDDLDAPCDEAPTKPVPVYQTEIEYLQSARADGVEGRLVLRIFVGPDGSVVRVEVVSSVQEALDAAAIATVRQWRFKPALACGRPVDGGVYTIARKFELGD